MRKYILARYRQRRADALTYLGNKCSQCDSKIRLEFDHIDPREKKFEIAKMWSVAKEDFWEEVRKCQLLCKKCHQKKTLKDLGQQDARKTHGTLSSYRYCKCELCRKVKSDYMKIYKRTHKRILKNGKRIWADSSTVTASSF